MILLENITKDYLTRRGIVTALNNINLHIEKGEFVTITGPSGSGKTTLLMIIAGMLKPTAGKVIFNSYNLYETKLQNRIKIRSEHIGFVFQMFHLIPYLNVIENIGLSDRGKRKAFDYNALINSLSLQGRVYHKPSELSAGEKQRVALARALINEPPVILADEPTGNLDRDNAWAIMEYLRKLHESGRTIIMASHNTEFVNYGKRTINLQNGNMRK